MADLEDGTNLSSERLLAYFQQQNDLLQASYNGTAKRRRITQAGSEHHSCQAQIDILTAEVHELRKQLSVRRIPLSLVNLCKANPTSPSYQATILEASSDFLWIFRRVHHSAPNPFLLHPEEVEEANLDTPLICPSLDERGSYIPGTKIPLNTPLQEYHASTHNEEDEDTRAPFNEDLARAVLAGMNLLSRPSVLVIPHPILTDTDGIRFAACTARHIERARRHIQDAIEGSGSENIRMIVGIVEIGSSFRPWSIHLGTRKLVAYWPTTALQRVFLPLTMLPILQIPEGESSTWSADARLIIPEDVDWDRTLTNLTSLALVRQLIGDPSSEALGITIIDIPDPDKDPGTSWNELRDTLSRHFVLSLHGMVKMVERVLAILDKEVAAEAEEDPA